VLRLGFSEDSLHNDDKFLFINFEFRLILIISSFVLGNSVTEQETSQFKLLLLIVVRSDLIKPKTHGLCVVLFALCSDQSALGFLSQSDDHFIFVLTPLGSVFTVTSVLVSIVVGATDTSLEVTAFTVFSSAVATLVVRFTLLIVTSLASAFILLEISTFVKAGSNIGQSLSDTNFSGSDRVVYRGDTCDLFS
jgi:hypothetical protein